jgi:hypothetical protein
VFDRATGEPVVLPKQSPGTISDLDGNGGIKESMLGTINQEPKRHHVLSESIHANHNHRKFSMENYKVSH